MVHTHPIAGYERRKEGSKQEMVNLKTQRE
jgi:hypothetical protein